MKLVCAPATFDFSDTADALRVVLYSQPWSPEFASAGATARHTILRERLDAEPRAWDLLSIGLAVMTADLAGLRGKSPDGWTRMFELDIAVAEPDFWTTQVPLIEKALSFLTTDIWRLRFFEGGVLPAPGRELIRPEEDSVVLLSGGLDSMVGAIDLNSIGMKPLAVSQIVRGDAKKQISFARRIGDGLRHLQLNHNANIPGSKESSQRARSFIFIAFGVLAATTLMRYRDGGSVPLYICENGFIALNPPLTGTRIGSLSTRTAHPEFLTRVQKILDFADLRVQIKNPYQLKTKGEMLIECKNQEFLKTNAAATTSCGRFQRFNYRHCGRCVPCQVRRSSFVSWGHPDSTKYIYNELGEDDEDHAGFDDVRSVAMAIAEVKSTGLDSWIGSVLSMPSVIDVARYKSLIERGLAEVARLHELYGVK